jgi:hypothetical protein
MSAKTSARAIICPASGTALVYVLKGDGEREGTIYRLGGGDEGPIECPHINQGIYFQGPTAPLQGKELIEEYPFPQLHEELKQIQRREWAYLNIRMCMDPDVSPKTRLELCEEIKDDFDDEAFRAEALRKIHEKLPSLRLDLEGLPTEGNLGRIFVTIKHIITV